MSGSLEAANTFLRGRFDSEATDIAPIGQGAWAHAYVFRRGSDELVIRFSALDEDFQKDRLAARFVSPALPIPAVIEMGPVDSGFYAISERVHGEHLDTLDEERMRTILPSLFATLDAMRQADLSATRGYGMWGADGDGAHGSWREALLDVGTDRPEKRTHGWRARLEGSPRGARAFDAAFAALRRLADDLPEERHLIHGDLLNFNVLVDDERISAVIDWGSAMYGDFVYDLAWFLFWQPWYPAWQGIDFLDEAVRHYAAIGLEAPHLEGRLGACQLHIGLDSLAYNAYQGRWEALAEVAEQTLAVAHAIRDGLE